MSSPAAVSAADPRLRARLVALLSSRCALVVTAGVTPLQALAAQPAPQLLVAVCDLDVVSDRATLRELAREREELRIVVVCDPGDGRSARLAHERWIDGFVFTDQLEAVLAPTVTAVLAGQAVVPRRMRRLLRRPTLSFREKQILALVVLGHTNGQIGARLFLSESTVKSHLSSSFVKLGVRSRSDAARLVLDPEESRGLGIDQIIESFSRPDAPLSLAAGAG